MRHECRLCCKSFADGRALGEHIKSHMLLRNMKNDIVSPSSCPSSSEDQEPEEKASLGYGLREKPKRSVRFVDHEFSFASVLDRESEAESSKKPSRRRTKRARKLILPEFITPQSQVKQLKNGKKFKLSNSESDPISCISDTTTEDVAFCLLMLSRDRWTREKVERVEQKFDDDDDDEDDEDDGGGGGDDDAETDESEEFRCLKNRSKGKYYKCETCSKVFKSYQALGGHRASHNKLRVHGFNAKDAEFEVSENAGGSTSSAMVLAKVHECPYCHRVFSSGQALGGHKRSHAGAAGPPLSTPSSTKSAHRLLLIDLNLPAPIDHDDDDGDADHPINHIDMSAVSDS